MEIKNAQVVITGANRGIGKAFAKSCAEDKAHLHLVVRNKDAALAKEMEDAGAASVTLWAVDFSNRNSIKNLLESMTDVKVDILFNNAGVLTGGLLEEQSEDELYNVLQVNVAAVMQLTHAFLPGMLQRQRGKIINNSSVSAIMHLPGASTYSASKAAVFAFTECLKNELHGTKVTTLNLITPGVKTQMFEEISQKYSKNYEELLLASLTPATYAQMIREAVLDDLTILEPQGLTGVGLQIAKYMPQFFDWGARRRFRR